MVRTLLALALLGMICTTQVRAESVCEDTKCCLPGSVFCLSEKAESDPTYFLSEAAVKDLGLNEEQLTRIRELVKKTKEEIQKECKHLERPKKESTRKECAEFRKEMKKICEKHYPKCMEELKKILGKEQIEKLQTRIFQYYGFVPCPIALSVLDLNEKQKKELLELCEQNCEKIHAMGSEKSHTGQDLHEKISQCRKECSEKVKNILTGEQITKAERLLKEVPEYVKKMRTDHEQVRAASRESSTPHRNY